MLFDDDVYDGPDLHKLELEFFWGTFRTIFVGAFPRPALLTVGIEDSDDLLYRPSSTDVPVGNCQTSGCLCVMFSPHVQPVIIL